MQAVRLCALLLAAACAAAPGDPQHHAASEWSDSGKWAVRLKSGSGGDEAYAERARHIATQLGLVSLGAVGALENVYAFRQAQVQDSQLSNARPGRSAADLETELLAHEHVESVHGQQPLQRVSRMAVPTQQQKAAADEGSNKRRDAADTFNDPLFGQEWYLVCMDCVHVATVKWIGSSACGC